LDGSTTTNSVVLSSCTERGYYSRSRFSSTSSTMRRLQEIASKLLLLILLIWFVQDCSKSAVADDNKTNLRRLDWFGWGGAEGEDEQAISTDESATKTVDEQTIQAASYEFSGVIESVACEPDHAHAVQFVSQFGPLSAGNEDCAAEADPDSCANAGGCCRFGNYFLCDTTNDFPDLPCVCGRNTNTASTKSNAAQGSSSSTHSLTNWQEQAIQAINDLDQEGAQAATYLDGWGDDLADGSSDGSTTSIEHQQDKDGELGNETLVVQEEEVEEAMEEPEVEESPPEEEKKEVEGGGDEARDVTTEKGLTIPPAGKIDADMNLTEVFWKPTYDMEVDEKTGILAVVGEEEWEAKVVNTDKVSVVAFVVPWCHGCEALRPQYEEAAEELTDDDVQFVWFDATDAKNGDITKEFNLTRFPTIVVIQNGNALDRSKDDRYEGLHLAVHFLNNFLVEDGDVDELDEMETTLHMERSFEEPCDATPRDGPTSDGTVKTVLGQDQWAADVVYSPLLTMVAFTAPWCPGCQALHPAYDAAAAQLMGQAVQLVWVDATDPSNANIVAEYDVTGYPKIVILPAGSPKSSTQAEQYQGGRTTFDITNAIYAALGGSVMQPQPPETPPPQASETPPPETPPPQPVYDEAVSTADEVATARDGPVSDGFVQVVHSPAEWSSDVVASPLLTMVAFVSPLHYLCQELQPQYVSAASTLIGKEVQLVWVDATDPTNAPFVQLYGVTEYPKIIIQPAGSPKDSGQSHEYVGARTADAIVDAMMTELGGAGAVQEQSTTGAEITRDGQLYDGMGYSDGLVKTVLGQDQWAANVVYNPLLTMVAFTAPWCPGCQALHPEYDAAAAQLMGQAVQLVWVDATDPNNANIVAEYGVTGYPKIVILPAGSPKSSIQAQQYLGGRTAYDITNAIYSALGSIRRLGRLQETNSEGSHEFDDLETDEKKLNRSLKTNVHGSEHDKNHGGVLRAKAKGLPRM
jgi:thiol-disulfide isomerase/thioredoxin